MWRWLGCAAGVLVVLSVVLFPHLWVQGLRAGRLVVGDLIRAWRRQEVPHFYGVWLYVGLPGRGKTVSVVEYLDRMRRRWGDRILIYTNFGWVHQDGPLDDWHQLLEVRDRPTIYALDEVQLTFSSRSWQSFPPEMLVFLTQNRKWGVGAQLLATAQSFDRVDKIFRELTHFVIECRTVAGRWTFQRAFETEDYMRGQDPQVGRLRRRAWRYSFVQTDELRGQYDTMKRLDKLASDEYLTLAERAKLAGD